MDLAEPEAYGVTRQPPHRRIRCHPHPRRLFLVTFGVALAIASSATAQSPAPPSTPPDPPYRADRGPGVATSMCGTYVRGGELLVYPFVEHYRDRNFEYKPSEFGFAGEVDHRGRYRASEALFFLAYGLTDDLAIELEGAAVRASLDKAASDRSAVPALIAESGVGDIEGQLRWRWKRETATGPEAFSYLEAVSPRNRDTHPPRGVGRRGHRGGRGTVPRPGAARGAHAHGVGSRDRGP